MTAPADVPHVSDPTVAWNSIAHGEITEPAPGQTRVLAPLEPLKVGVATVYGNLQVVKAIGENPGNDPVDGVEFTFAYDCTLSSGAPSVSGEVTATSTTPGVVTDLPAGATCKVWETDTHGGVPSVTEDDPAVVVIEPSLTPDDPVLSAVTVTNDFPLTPPSPPAPPTPPSPPAPPPPPGTATVTVVKSWVGKPFSTAIFVDGDGSAPYNASAQAGSRRGASASASFPVSTHVTVGETRLRRGYRAVIDCGSGWHRYRRGGFEVVAPAQAGQTLTCRLVNRAQPRLVVSKRVMKKHKRVRFGHTVRFRITVKNRGPGVARSVTVCDRLPRKLVFVRTRGARLRDGDACWRVRRLRAGKARGKNVRVKPVRVARRVKVKNVACASLSTGGRARRCDRAAIRVLPAAARGGGVTG